jgi:hypothetical protein
VGNEFCALARPIYFSEDSHLSVEDMRYVMEHNEMGVKLCDWPGMDD